MTTNNEFKHLIVLFNGKYYSCFGHGNIWKKHKTFGELKKEFDDSNIVDGKYSDKKFKEIIEKVDDFPQRFDIISLKGDLVFSTTKKQIRKRLPTDFCLAGCSTKYNSKAKVAPFMKFLKDVLGHQLGEFSVFIGSVIRRESVRGMFLNEVPSSRMNTLINCIVETLDIYFDKMKIESMSNLKMSRSSTKMGSFIYSYEPDFIQRYPFKRIMYSKEDTFEFPEEITPILIINPHEQQPNIRLGSRYYHRQQYVFHFNTAFVDKPTHSKEKEIDRNIEEKLLANKEGIMRVLLNFAKAKIPIKKVLAPLYFDMDS